MPQAVDRHTSPADGATAEATPGPTQAPSPLLAPGRNCWRIERAGRVALLVDAAAYFGALRQTLARARHTIRIVGWDIDSRTRITADPVHAPTDGLPEALGELLNALAARRRTLRAQVLGWDFPMLYATEREVLPVYALGWRTHRRVAFCLDGEHPVGASHHQKLVVVDDTLAYAGGIDLSVRRWDTPAHAPGDARRQAPDGAAYDPFHDVQLLLDGSAAAALGEVAADRWRHGTGRNALPRALQAPRGHDGWPAGVVPDFTQIDVAIARTQAAHGGHPAVTEIRQLHLDAIEAARHSLYIENQYLTSSLLADALDASLQKPEGPEMVVVTRRSCGGWLEAVTMEVLRARVLQRLRQADRHGRLRVYFADLRGPPGDDGTPGTSCEPPIVVHSKLMIVDDRLLIVGSANASNRSMVLDTELCVAIEAPPAEADADEQAQPVRRAIAGIRRRLLAEHLGCTPGTVAQAEHAHGGLIAAVESLRGTARTLTPQPAEVDPDLDGLVPDAALLDPEEAVDLEALADELVPPAAQPSLRRRALLLAGFVLLLALTAAAWRWTPLSALVDLRAVAAGAQALLQGPLAPLWVLAAYVVGSLLAVPVTLLIVVTALVYGAWSAFGYAMAGSLLAAALTFGIGHALGRDLVGRLAGERLNRLNARLGRRGLLAVVTVRILPLAPFTVVNLAAGASKIRLRDFLLGTMLGMLPGILAITVFSDRVLAVLRDPSGTTLATLAAVAAALVGALWALRRWLRRRDAGPAGHRMAQDPPARAR